MKLKFIPILMVSVAVLLSSCGKTDFSGDYSFLVGQSIVVTNPYGKEKSTGLASLFDNKSRAMGLAPIKLKLQKQGKEYKGQMSMSLLQQQTMFGMKDDTSEMAFELKNFMPAGDTLNFLITAEVPMMGSQQLKAFLVKGKENILGIQKDIIDEPDCFEQNPAFMGQSGQMFLFKELAMTGDAATKQMAQAYRDCLFEIADKESNKYTKKGKMKTVMYVDSVLLRAE